MRSFVKFAAAVFVAVNLAGCGSANQRVAHADFGSTKALATTGALRIVTERERKGYQPVVCAEPSPDYAVAFDRTTSAAIGVNVPAPVPTPAKALNADGSDATVEHVQRGDGRTAAIVALRDGLYAACQSYANGVIGHDAYALILSQYGHLLVALVGGAGGAKTQDEAKLAGRAVVIEGRRATLSTLVVACMSGYDRTRLDAPGPNRLLTERYCRSVMSAALDQATVK